MGVAFAAADQSAIMESRPLMPMTGWSASVMRSEGYVGAVGLVSLEHAKGMKNSIANIAMHWDVLMVVPLP